MSPLYILVTNSKVDLVHQAVRENPFNSSYFVWMDGGYGHGETEEDRIFTQGGVRSPSHLLDFPGQWSADESCCSRICRSSSIGVVDY